MANTDEFIDILDYLITVFELKMLWLRWEHTGITQIIYYNISKLIQQIIEKILNVEIRIIVEKIHHSQQLYYKEEKYW